MKPTPTTYPTGNSREELLKEIAEIQEERRRILPPWDMSRPYDEQWEERNLILLENSLKKKQQQQTV